MIEITIEKQGSLMPVLLQQKITQTQVSMIRALLGNPDITYGEFLDFLHERDERLAAAAFDLTIPIGGIEQYQTEDR
jgi:hypothetical protein